jgi:hypothetical protein
VRPRAFVTRRGLAAAGGLADNVAMGAVAFDTHAFVKRLVSAGMPEAQAEALADEQKRLLDEQLATKRDIEDVRREIELLRAEVKREIEEVRREIELLRGEVKREIELLRGEVKREIELLRGEFKRDLKDTEQRLTIRLGLMLAAAVAIVSALVGIF